MSIELKITGADAEDFAYHMHVLARVFPRMEMPGFTTTAAVEPPPPVVTEAGDLTPEPADEGIERAIAAAPKRGRKVKPAQVDIEEAIAEASVPNLTASMPMPELPEAEVVQDNFPADDFDEGKKAPTQQELKDAMLALLAAKGDDAPPAVLAKFGATKLSQVKVSDYARAIKACNLAAAEKGE
jgi:hypothetical protein